MAKQASHCPKLPWMIDFHSTAEGTIPNSQLQAAFAENFTEHHADLNIRSQTPKHRLTGIICTIGPSSNDRDILQNMMEAGMSMARLKMCHFNHEECSEVLQMIREANDNYSRKIGRIYPLAIALDIRGPEIRTGSFKDPEIEEIELVEGNSVNITTDLAYEEHVTEDMIYVDYQKISDVLEPGDQVLIGDGAVRLSAFEIVGSTVKCVIQNAGKLLSRASVTLPGIPIDLPIISEKDVKDIKFGVENKVDVIFISGMRNKETIHQIREILGQEGKHILVISKVDSCQALDYIEVIIKESDGIVIDRGTLGTELLPEKLFLAQKSIIAKCNKAGKPVVCSTQILESMLTNPQPTKPEVSDIANAVLDGADCFLLSKETSIGQQPVKSITVLDSICKEAEAAVYQKQVFSDLSSKQLTPIEPIYALSISAVEASLKCNAAVIVVLTTTGRSAKILTKFRPRCPIIAITRFAQVARQLHLFRAVDPIQYIKPPKTSWEKDIDERIQLGISWGKVSGFIRAGDAIIILTGNRPGAGFTNSMKVVYASEFDVLPICYNENCLCP